MLIVSTYFYYKALKSISNLTSSNIIEIYQKFIFAWIFVFALYGVINFTQISKTTLYLVSLLGFIAIIYSLIMWLKIHYNLAKITENKIFKIYATSSIVALILITIAAASISSIIFFTYFENPNELILMQLKMQTYIIILNYITMLVLNFILLFAWTKAKDINLQKIAE